MTPAMEGYLLTEPQRQGLISYLAQQPYAEVRDAIAGLSQLPKVTVPADDEPRPVEPTSYLNDVDHPTQPPSSAT